MAGKKGMKHYPLEFRQMIVDLHLQNGHSKKWISREYGVHNRQILNWVRWYEQYGAPKQITGKARGRPKTSGESLEEENKRLRMENELLKKFHELLKEEHKRK